MMAVLTFALPASGETLPEAMRMALETNPSLASSRAQVRAVREALPLAWSEALPQISGSATATQILREENQPAISIREQPEYWIASLNTSTLLFGSGRVMASTRQARAQIATALASYQDVAQRLLIDVTRAYGDVIASREGKAAQEQSLANLEEQLRYVQANVRQGFLTQTDLAQARARVEQARAGLAQSDLQVVQATEAYRRLVGIAPGELAQTPLLEGLPGDLQTALDTAADNSPSILAAIGAAESADAAVSAAAAQGRPRLTIDTTNSFFETINQRNVREAGEDAVSVRFTLPIFSGGSISARTRQQRANRAAAEFDLTNTQREVHERVSVAWSGVAASRASRDALQVRVEAAELAQRGMQREQQAGLRSVIDVLNQEEELLRARVDLAGAERDYLVAQRELAASVGRLAALSSLEVDPRAGNERRLAPRSDPRRVRIIGDGAPEPRTEPAIIDPRRQVRPSLPAPRVDPRRTRIINGAELSPRPAPGAATPRELAAAPELVLAASRTQSRPRHVLSYRAETLLRCDL
ncbi:type I secretion outer membrane protein tolC precursor [alpha proteobacterium U9-1i]|nr:type I secretion outer membrane protein tolC precursor [alpha proteobacterium U9-1i]